MREKEMTPTKGLLPVLRQIYKKQETSWRTSYTTAAC